MNPFKTVCKILFAYLLSGCEPPFHCDEQHYTLSQDGLSLVEYMDNVQDSIYFKSNSSGNLIGFGKIRKKTSHIYDTLGNICYNYDYIIVAHYTKNSLIRRLLYTLVGDGPTYRNQFIISVGPDEHNLSCVSEFKIDPATDTFNFNQINLSNKTFYNVYHRNSSLTNSCCTDIYYNKQYGVVGFNWLGEWYVLETDSL